MHLRRAMHALLLCGAVLALSPACTVGGALNPAPPAANLVSGEAIPAPAVVVRSVRLEADRVGFRSFAQDTVSYEWGWDYRFDVGVPFRLAELRATIGAARTEDGRYVQWTYDNPGTGSASRIQLGDSPQSAGVADWVTNPVFFPRPRSTPRLNGFVFRDAVRLRSSTADYGFVGLWRSSDGRPRTRLVAFNDDAARPSRLTLAEVAGHFDSVSVLADPHGVAVSVNLAEGRVDPTGIRHLQILWKIVCLKDPAACTSN